MQTDHRDETTWSSGAVFAFAIAVLVAAGGCEYLGLDGSGGGGGGSSSGGSASADKKESGGSDQGDDKQGSQNGDDKQASEDGESDKQEGSSGEGEEEAAAEAERPSPSGEEQAETQSQNRRRNPFAAATEFQGEDDDETEDETESTGQSGPLRRYSYEKYRLSGLISETAVPKAMFIAPDQVGHLVKKGDRIGKEGGVVQDIRDNAVELELPPQGEEGRSRTVTMELRESELPDEQQQKGLSEEEQKALQDLLESEEGRKEIRERFQQDSSSGRSGGGGDGGSDGFQGLEPPE